MIGQVAMPNVRIQMKDGKPVRVYCLACGEDFDTESIALQDKFAKEHRDCKPQHDD